MVGAEGSFGIFLPYFPYVSQIKQHKQWTFSSVARGLKPNLSIPYGWIIRSKRGWSYVQSNGGAIVSYKWCWRVNTLFLQIVSTVINIGFWNIFCTLTSLWHIYAMQLSTIIPMLNHTGSLPFDNFTNYFFDETTTTKKT